MAVSEAATVKKGWPVQLTMHTLQLSQMSNTALVDLKGNLATGQAKVKSLSSALGNYNVIFLFLCVVICAYHKLGLLTSDILIFHLWVITQDWAHQ